MNDGKCNRVTTFVVIGVLIFSFAGLAGCGGYVGSGGGGGSKGYSITGTAVDSITLKPVAGAQVALEQPDAGGIDRIIVSTTTLSDGSFSFSPSSGSYDVVVDATVTAPSAPTVTYAATVTFGVPANANLNQIPLVPEFGSSMPTGNPATIFSTVSTSASSSVVFTGNVDIKLSALQAVSPAVGTVSQITIPAFPGSNTTVTTMTAPPGMTCQIGTTCSNYTLVLPEGDFSFGRFSISGTQYMLSIQQHTQVAYTVEGRAFVHLSGFPLCSPSSFYSQIQVGGGTLTLGSAILTFTGCS